MMTRQMMKTMTLEGGETEVQDEAPSSGDFIVIIRYLCECEAHMQ